MKRGIIFDMDGTLWDSSAQVAEAWNLAIVRSGCVHEPLTAEDLKRVMGKTMDEIAELLFPDAGKQEKNALLAACCELENQYLRSHGGMLYPKLRGTMETLAADYHLYIVSNCQTGYIEAFLDYYGMNDLIEDKLCFGENGRMKADNIRILYDRNGLDDAVYVGDIQGDYDSSRKAGVKFIHAAYGFGTIEEDVPEIDSFSALVQAVPAVFADWL